MPIRELRKQLIGKTFIGYDGWNGSLNSFVIGYIRNHKKDVYLIRQSKDSGWPTYLSKDTLEQLIAVGSVCHSNTIDGCSFNVTYQLK